MVAAERSEASGTVALAYAVVKDTVVAVGGGSDGMMGQLQQ